MNAETPAFQGALTLGLWFKARREARVGRPVAGRCNALFHGPMSTVRCDRPAAHSGDHEGKHVTGARVSWPPPTRSA